MIKLRNNKGETKEYTDQEWEAIVLAQPDSCTLDIPTEVKDTDWFIVAEDYYENTNKGSSKE